MAKRKPMELPDSFYALFDYLRSRGYTKNSVFEYESHARWVAKFMQENGYVDIDQLERILNNETTGKEKCDQILEVALAAGSKDDMTVILACRD